MNHPVKLGCVAGIVFLFFGCAPKYTLYPKYFEVQPSIKTIALYPMHYSRDGEEQRRFGLFFTTYFYDSIMQTEYTQPYRHLPPDSTVAWLASKGVNVAKTEFPYKGAPEMTTYAALTPSELMKLSDRAEVLLFCDLINYNEVTQAGQAAQIAGDIALGVCLGAGAPKVSEDNLVNMNLILYSTKTGERLWERSSCHTIGISDPEVTRIKFTNKIYWDYRKYCPLTRQFEAELAKKNKK